MFYGVGNHGGGPTVRNLELLREYAAAHPEKRLISIRFEEYSGYITSFYDKRTGKERICSRAAVPVVIDEYYHDTWSHGKTFFADEMARYSDAEVTVTESGPVRACVKIVSTYNHSTLTQYFSLTADSDVLSIRLVADRHEKHKMLKIAYPMAVTDPEAFYEIPFGAVKRPADGEEKPGLRWTAVRGREGNLPRRRNALYLRQRRQLRRCRSYRRCACQGLPESTCAFCGVEGEA